MYYHYDVRALEGLGHYTYEIYMRLDKAVLFLFFVLSHFYSPHGKEEVLQSCPIFGNVFDIFEEQWKLFSPIIHGLEWVPSIETSQKSSTQ